MSELLVEVSYVGWQASLTDLGRRDAEIRGVPSGGAADPHSATVANLLVGNRRDAVLIEVIGDFSLRAPVPMLMAVTGAPVQVSVGGQPVESWQTLVVPAGEELTVSDAHGALRNYIALGGTLEAPRFLGSAAPDLRMGFRQELLGGQSLRVSRPSPIAALCRLASPRFDFPVPRLVFPEGPWFLNVVRAAEAAQIPGIDTLLAESSYTVKPQSDHVGVRLAGPVLHPKGPEIVSHGVPIGAVEIPHADDELILLGRYRTLTAGYPIVGIVARTDLPLIGQLACNTEVRFLWIERSEAVRRAVAHEDALACLERSVRDAFADVFEQSMASAYAATSTGRLAWVY